MRNNRSISPVFFLITIFINLLFLLPSCVDSKKSDPNYIKVGVEAGPEYIIAQKVQEIAKQKYGLTVELVQFNDYIMPNTALDQGDLDANAFQTKAFLDEQTKLRGYHFSIVGKTFIYPMAAYSKKIRSIDELQEGATIAIPNEVSILLITHEMAVVKAICDKVAVLSKGRLIEQGLVANIFSDPKEELTRQFISSTTHLQIPFDYKKKLADEPSPGKHLLIYLEISGQSVANSILSEITKRYSIDSHIICSKISYIGGTQFGAMLIELNGNRKTEWKVVEYFKTKNINVKIHGYV